MKILTGNESVDKIMCLTLTKARNISRRAGIGWTALDKNGEVLICEAVIAGIGKAKLTHTIRSYSAELNHLFMTSEPMGGVYNVAELIEAIEHSNCEKITFAHRGEVDLIDAGWRKWCSGWQGVIDYLPLSYAASRLTLGIESVQTKKRPWLTVICAANIAGESLPLVQLVDEFGVKDNISMYVMHSRALLCTSTQIDVIDSLPDANFMGEPISPFEISKNEDIHSILKYCAADLRCSAVIMGSLDVLAYLLKANVVDEIVYHIAGFEKSVINSGENANPLSKSAIDLSGWYPTSCSPAGRCCRIVLRKESGDNAKKYSKHRLN